MKSLKLEAGWVEVSSPAWFISLSISYSVIFVNSNSSFKAHAQINFLK